MTSGFMVFCGVCVAYTLVTVALVIGFFVCCWMQGRVK